MINFDSKKNIFVINDIEFNYLELNDYVKQKNLDLEDLIENQKSPFSLRHYNKFCTFVSNKEFEKNSAVFGIIVYDVLKGYKLVYLRKTKNLKNSLGDISIKSNALLDFSKIRNVIINTNLNGYLMNENNKVKFVYKVVGYDTCKYLENRLLSAHRPILNFITKF